MLSGSCVGVQLHSTGIEIHRIVWHFYSGGAVKLRLRVWLHWTGSGTVDLLQFSGAELRDTLVLHCSRCLGAGHGEGGRDTGVECIKCWCQPQAWAQTMDNASPLCLSH